MHDKPDPDTPITTETSTERLIETLADVDPAAAPDVADAIAERLEASLTVGDGSAA